MSKICINNEGLERHLTIGKSYVILVSSNKLYEIINDLNMRMFIKVERFE
jgi:hypothetical protein